ncbi:hypothetical protein FZO89_08360 [Luteimonas viscosa]|uniref:Uroporphyrin-3 C-methyltransferase n=1 Tax=Luteimonas viscosa TaxID=1132694 RepID=A0A5D4XRA0_9GAMM|nr:uroporphyrinogen-III C-methyltransferase [Luteimonas viscosa]TYT26271.1 hypothetical protein FZO89_08360 [Luteimonas viscosa]
MSDTPTVPAASRRRTGSAIAWVLVLALLGAAAFAGWQRWEAVREAGMRAADADRQRIGSLEERIATLRRDQRAQTARLQQAEATNRLLREEVIGLGQRAALVEESVQRLADPERDAAQALRLDEVELLLAQGQQRLQLAGDLDGARQAYALAAQLLDGIADPAWLDLRQALTQERAALDALGEDPKAVAAGRLEAFAAALPSLPREASAARAAPAWWERAFSKVVDVRPSAAAVAVDPADRAAGLAALQLELTLGQAAIERRDEAGYRAALSRVDGWLLRLWPDSAERADRRRALQALRQRPLRVELPALGSTLTQLRQQRSAR